MSVGLLVRLRLASFILCVGGGVGFAGGLLGLWGAVATPVVTLVSMAVGAIGVYVYSWLETPFQRAVKREREGQESAKQAAAAAESLRLLESGKRSAAMRERAVALARNEYPQYVDEDTLVTRGWRVGEYDDDFAMYLDPAELVLEYAVEGDAQKTALRLYDRERVRRVEEGNREVRSMLALRLALRQQAELEEKRKAEESRAEEALHKERAERLARQTIIGIDASLKFPPEGGESP